MTHLTMRIVELDITSSGEGDATGPIAKRRGLVEPTGRGAVGAGDGTGPVPPTEPRPAG
jgi:hypothetical protein